MQHRITGIPRSSAGIYYDFFFQNQIDAERALLGPAGSGRQTVLGSAVLNPLAGIPGVLQGTPLNFTGSPTPFTGADLLSILPAIRAGLTSNLASSDPSLTNIQILKQGNTFVSPADLPAWSSQHASVGVQRELARDFVVSAESLRRSCATLAEISREVMRKMALLMPYTANRDARSPFPCLFMPCTRYLSVRSRIRGGSFRIAPHVYSFCRPSVILWITGLRGCEPYYFA